MENVDNRDGSSAAEGDAFSADLLNGVKEIAGFLGPHFTPRMVYHMAAARALPTFKLPGSKIVRARKSEIRLAFSSQNQVA